MAKRRFMSRKKSSRNFRRGRGRHPRNFATNARGGYRI